MKKLVLLFLSLFLLLCSCTTSNDSSSAPEKSAVSNAESDTSSLPQDDSTPDISDETSNETSDKAPENGQPASSVSAIVGFNYADVKNFNKNSGGYILEANGVLYFSNSEDNNCLYKQFVNKSSVPEKIGEIKSEFRFSGLQLYGDKLLYLNSVRLDKAIETEYATVPFANEIICFDLTDKKETLLIGSQTIIDYVVHEGYIYYTTYDDSAYGTLYRFSLGDNSTEKLSEFNYPMTIQEYNCKLYLGFGELLSVYDIAKGVVTNHMMPHAGFAVRDKTVYFIDLNDFCLYTMKYNSEIGDYDYEHRNQISDMPVSSFNVYGNGIILSDADSGKLMYINTDKSENFEFAIGQYPIITSVGIYYRTNDGDIEVYDFTYPEKTVTDRDRFIDKYGYDVDIYDYLLFDDELYTLLLNNPIEQWASDTASSAGTTGEMMDVEETIQLNWIREIQVSLDNLKDILSSDIYNALCVNVQNKIALATETRLLSQNILYELELDGTYSTVATKIQLNEAYEKIVFELKYLEYVIYDKYDISDKTVTIDFIPSNAN